MWTILVGAALAGAGADAKACTKARATDTATAWDRYLLRHPDGACADEAKARLDVLRAGAGGAALLQTSRTPDSALVEASVSDIAVEGPLSIADVQVALRGVKGPLETCFLRELARDPAFADVRWPVVGQVEPGGVLSAYAIETGAEGIGELETCVGREITSASFPGADRPSAIALVLTLAQTR